MKGLSLHDRPREKLDRLGAGALGDNELVAIVLGAGTVRHNALELANRLLEAAGGLHRLTRLTRAQVACVGGIGAARAAQVMAAIELGRRTLVRAASPRAQVGGPRDLAAMLLPLHGAQGVEQTGVVLLDTRHRVLRSKLLSIGSLDASLVHPREVFREAVVSGASAVVVFHNHPSGDPAPSREDVDLTRRLVAAGEIMGIALLDHLILADSRYYSFRENNGL